MDPLLVIVTTLRSLVEVAGLMLLIRGAIWLLGPKARNNFAYGIFTVGSMPFIRFTRWALPRAVADTLIPTLTFLLLFALWAGLVLSQQSLCAMRPGQCG